ncbi:hypothetical protein STEG23_018115 [Scotinomys teguina]
MGRDQVPVVLLGSMAFALGTTGYLRKQRMERKISLGKRPEFGNVVPVKTSGANQFNTEIITYLVERYQEDSEFAALKTTGTQAVHYTYLVSGKSSHYTCHHLNTQLENSLEFPESHPPPTEDLTSTHSGAASKQKPCIIRSHRNVVSQIISMSLLYTPNRAHLLDKPNNSEEGA